MIIQYAVSHSLREPLLGWVEKKEAAKGNTKLFVGTLKQTPPNVKVQQCSVPLIMEADRRPLCFRAAHFHDSSATGLWDLTTSVIQQKRVSQRLTTNTKRGLPYHIVGLRSLVLPNL